MASDTSTTDTATAVTDTAAVVSGFSGVVATLKASYDAGTPASAWSVLGKIKIINNAIDELGLSPSLELMNLKADLAEIANLYLPQDTRDVLESTNASSDLALEIVCRNLTQLPVLAKRLYQVSRR